MHDDSALDLIKSESSQSALENDDPFANVSGADFTFAKEKDVKLQRRQTMAP